jgi:hypothetical protein
MDEVNRPEDPTETPAEPEVDADADRREAPGGEELSGEEAGYGHGV